VTATPFDATDDTAVAASATSGGATVVVSTDVAGDVTAVGTNTPGSGYSVGDTVTFSEDGGAGVLTARVASIS
jgi:hypothetical protein